MTVDAREVLSYCVHVSLENETRCFNNITCLVRSNSNRDGEDKKAWIGGRWTKAVYWCQQWTVKVGKKEVQRRDE